MPETSTATRAFWSGTLSFGLVSIPVDLYAANRGRELSLKMLGPSGEPLKRRYVCSQEGKPLDKDELVRGFETEEGQFVTVDKQELEALEPDKTRDIDLNRFVERKMISPAYFERGYYLVPSGQSTKAYRLLAETMERSGRAGIATFVMRSKAYVVAIFSEGGILQAETLRFHDELRSPQDVGLPSPDNVDEKQVAAMKKLILAKKAKAFSPEALHDEQAQRLRAVAEKKWKHNQDVVETRGGESEDIAGDEEDEAGDDLEGGGKVIDLMQVLRSKLGVKGASKPPKRKGPAKAPTNKKAAKKQTAAKAAPTKHAARKTRKAAKPSPRKKSAAAAQTAKRATKRRSKG